MTKNTGFEIARTKKKRSWNLYKFWKQRRPSFLYPKRFFRLLLLFSSCFPLAILRQRQQNGRPSTPSSDKSINHVQSIFHTFSRALPESISSNICKVIHSLTCFTLELLTRNHFPSISEAIVLQTLWLFWGFSEIVKTSKD